MFRSGSRPSLASDRAPRAGEPKGSGHALLAQDHVNSLPASLMAQVADWLTAQVATIPAILTVTTPADPGRWLRLVCATSAQIPEYVPLRFSTKPRQQPGPTGGRALKFWRWRSWVGPACEVDEGVQARPRPRGTHPLPRFDEVAPSRTVVLLRAGSSSPGGQYLAVGKRAPAAPNHCIQAERASPCL